MTDTVETLPDFACPSCGGVAAATEKACSLCGCTFVIELQVAKVDDPKLAYLAARAMYAFEPAGAKSAAEVARLLALRPFRLVSRKDLVACSKLIAELKAIPVTASARIIAEPAVKASGGLAATLQKPAVLGTLGIAAVAIVGFIFFRPAAAPAPTVDALPPPMAVTQQAPAPIVAESAPVDEGPVTIQMDEAPASAAPEAAEPFSLEKVRRSIVTLTTSAGVQGSGFIVHPGYVLTNSHVVESVATGATLDVHVTGENGNKKVAARVVTRDEKLDVALVQCGGPCVEVQPLPLGKAYEARAGATVYAVGSPLGLEHTLSKGIVSNALRGMNGVIYLQSDVQVNPGNSGGPLLDEQGRVLGLVTAKVMGADGISFILPIEYATEGPRAILNGVAPAASNEYSPRFKERLDKIAKASVGTVEASTRAAEPVLKEQIALDAAAIASNGVYGVRFRVLWIPTNAGTPNGPFYVVVQQRDTSYRGTFQMSNVKPPQRLGEVKGALVYAFEHIDKLSGVQPFKPGDKITVRMRDDLFSNTIELVAR